ncbi:MAG: hypothetical protein EOO88_30405 [Pedobacter sp.]|nr:MAG: hypothetical protein EOO88_30405 [Pedobacter sp.]
MKIIILLTDSKFFTAFANLSYLAGIALMLLTFVIGKNINGSRSWIPLAGGFNLQAAELIRLYRNEGLTYDAIATRLNGMGFRTRRGNEFKAMSVQRLDFSKSKLSLTKAP